jgi:cytochrome c oxidase subunit I+III
MQARSRAGFAALLLAALISLSAASAVEFVGHWTSGLRPDASGYAALVYLAAVLQLQAIAAVVIIGLFVFARLVAGRLDATRRVTFDSLALLAYYSAAQGLVGVLLVHGFPRVVA